MRVNLILPLKGNRKGPRETRLGEENPHRQLGRGLGPDSRFVFGWIWAYFKANGIGLGLVLGPDS